MKRRRPARGLTTVCRASRPVGSRAAGEMNARMNELHAGPVRHAYIASRPAQPSSIRTYVYTYEWPLDPRSLSCILTQPTHPKFKQRESATLPQKASARRSPEPRRQSLSLRYAILRSPPTRVANTSPRARWHLHPHPARRAGTWLGWSHASGRPAWTRELSEVRERRLAQRSGTVATATHACTCSLKRIPTITPTTLGIEGDGQRAGSPVRNLD
ncbi:hypothetical protein AcW1_006766 [Taiwanofungus camphoratus]|nr:hypothetical protein AcW1_006766 [Antrodia cinnamomea]